MKRIWVLALTLCVLLGISRIATAHESPVILTLDEALARVEYHSDYQAWESNWENSSKSIQAILDKHSLALDISGDLFTYRYEFERDESDFSTGPALSLSKSNLWGTNLSGSFSPKWNLSDGSVRSGWSLGLTQTLWPAPWFNSDQIALQTAYDTQAVLLKQRVYVVENTRFKIEKLYRTAQIAEARVSLAEAGLAAALRSQQVVEEKLGMGEAGEIDLINSQLNVLRAERDLESGQAAADAAKENLLQAVDLSGEFQLTSLDIGYLPEEEEDVDLEALLAKLHDHPLVLQHQVELKKAELELEAGQAASKPEASLSIILQDSSQSGLSGQGAGPSFVASVSIGYPILDKNQWSSTLETLSDNLEKARSAYEQALEQVERLFRETAQEVAGLARDVQIASLTLRQAELEWQAAQLQYEAGLIDHSSLVNAEVRLKQAELDYYESMFNYSWTKRRLNRGLVGELSGAGGQIR